MFICLEIRCSSNTLSPKVAWIQCWLVSTIRCRYHVDFSFWVSCWYLYETILFSYLVHSLSGFLYLSVSLPPYFFPCHSWRGWLLKPLSQWLVSFRFCQCDPSCWDKKIFYILRKRNEERRYTILIIWAYLPVNI